MKWFLSIFVLTIPFAIAQTTTYITEFRGFEDQFEKTHLYYRAGYYSNNFNPFYHFDIDSNRIDYFIDAFYWNYPPSLGGLIYKEIRDLKFWRYNPNYYIYCGTMQYPDNHNYISRFDNIKFYGSFGYDNLEISSQNDSLLYSGKPLYRSTTGGRLWEFVSNFNLVSVNQFNDQILFLSDGNNRLRKSTDGGVTSFYSETTAKWNYTYFNSRLYFDADSIHVYSVTDKKLFISSDGGELWNLVFTSQKDIKFSPDPIQSGRFCFAEGKNIYFSNNYGQTISLYKKLNRDVVGIHLKSNSNKIYAATSFQLLEITLDTVKSLKSFTLPNVFFNYYPLQIGNKWYFNTVEVDQAGIPPQYTYGFLTREVIRDSTADNGKRYYVVVEEVIPPTVPNTCFLERIDSTSGFVYRYDKTITHTKEYAVDDLLADLRDTISVNRFHPPLITNPNTIFMSIDTILFANRKLMRKNFYSPHLISYKYALMDSIGLSKINVGYDFGYKYINLKGCRIKGIVYGDTVLIKVEEAPVIPPNNFILYQNYPNPFGEAVHSDNSSTTIKFYTPRSTHITLKVYDILGREVATLVNEEKAPGTYNFEFSPAFGGQASNSELPNGVYFYQLRAGGYVETKKMIFLK